MKSLKLAAVIGAIAFFAAAPAQAAPIEYIFTGTFDGSLGTTNFTDQAFTISLIGSSTSVTSGGGEFFNATISNQFTIGATTGSLTGFFNELVLNPTFGSGLGAVAFAQSNSSAFVAEATVAGPLSAYNLATAFPLTAGTPNAIKQTYFTSVGDLVFNDITALSFEAKLNDTLPTPLPGALPLFAAALGLVAFASWLRKQKGSIFMK